MAGTRFLLAGFIMYAIARWQGAPHGSLANWRTALIVGACLLLGGNGGVTLAEQYVSSGLASVLVATVPIYIALLAGGAAPRPSRRRSSGSALPAASLGWPFFFGPALSPSPDENSHAGLGMVILLFSSFIWSAGSIYSRQSKSAAPPLLLAGQQMLCGGAPAHAWRA